MKVDENEIKWNEYFNHNFFNYEIEIILDIKKNDLNDTIKLINFDKFNNNNTELYIDDNKEPFKNEYKFNKIGNYFIKFIFKNKIIKSSLENMFYGCKNIKYINFNVFNTSNIKNMMSMFNGCSNLKKIDLSSFNTSNVKYMNEMFNDCSNLEEIDLSSFNTSNVKNMDYMFCCCSSLKKIDLSFFDTSNVKSMMCMFWGCCKAKEIDISSFDTSKVENMEFMFKDCCKLKEIKGINNFNIKNCDKRGIFDGCNELDYLTLSNNRIITDNKKLISKYQNSISIMFFISEQNIHYPIPCNEFDTFSKIEIKLFEEFPELKSKNIYYLANGNTLDKTSTLKQNKIKNGDTILIKPQE